MMLIENQQRRRAPETVHYLSCLYPPRLLWPGRVAPCTLVAQGFWLLALGRGLNYSVEACPSSWKSHVDVDLWIWAAFCSEALAHDKSKTTGTFVLVPRFFAEIPSLREIFCLAKFSQSADHKWFWAALWWRASSYILLLYLLRTHEFVKYIFLYDLIRLAFNLPYISRWFDLTGFQSSVLFHWESLSLSK